MGHMLLARNFAFFWALIACVFSYPYIGAGFIVLGALAHYLLIRAVFDMLPRDDR
jgi:multisubunit Na+/H+ antiporter MnhE subunit